MLCGDGSGGGGEAWPHKTFPPSSFRPGYRSDASTRSPLSAPRAVLCRLLTIEETFPNIYLYNRASKEAVLLGNLPFTGDTDDAQVAPSQSREMPKDYDDMKLHFSLKAPGFKRLCRGLYTARQYNPQKGIRKKHSLPARIVIEMLNFEKILLYTERHSS